MVKDAVCGVDEAGRGHFYCPHCGMDRCIAVAEKILTRNRFTDTCACGGEVSARVLLRALGRDLLQFSGSFRVRNRPCSGQILIKTLRFSALGFVCTDAHRLFPGDYLDLTFNLKNPEKTPVTLQAMVIDVHGMRVEAVRGEVYFTPPESTEKIDI